MTRKELIDTVNALVGADDAARQAAVQALEALPLGHFEDHPPPRSRMKPLLPELARVLREHPDESVKRWCAQLIGETAIATPDVLPALIWHLEKGAGSGVVSTVWALGEFGPAAEAAAPALVRHLRNPSPDVRWRAAWALDRIGRATDDAHRILATLFDDPHPTVRGYAVLAFIRFAERTPWAREQLEKAAGDPDVFPRTHARTALASWNELQNEHTTAG